MNRVLLLVALAAALVVVAGLSRRAAEAAPVPRERVPAAEPAPPPTYPDRPVTLGRRGRVTAVAADSVCVQGHDAKWGGRCRLDSSNHRMSVWVGGEVQVLNWTGQGASVARTGVRLVMSREGYELTGADGVVTTVRRADLPPRRYKLSADLVAGRLPADAEDYKAYLPADIRKWDEVNVDTRWQNGGWEVVTITIEQRPGGRVPPSRKPKPTNPYHEWATARQEYELNGTPLPEKYNKR